MHKVDIIDVKNALFLDNCYNYKKEDTYLCHDRFTLILLTCSIGVNLVEMIFDAIKSTIVTQKNIGNGNAITSTNANSNLKNQFTTLFHLQLYMLVDWMHSEYIN